MRSQLAQMMSMSWASTRLDGGGSEGLLFSSGKTCGKEVYQHDSHENAVGRVM